MQRNHLHNQWAASSSTTVNPTTFAVPTPTYTPTSTGLTVSACTSVASNILVIDIGALHPIDNSLLPAFGNLTAGLSSISNLTTTTGKISSNSLNGQCPVPYDVTGSNWLPFASMDDNPIEDAVFGRQLINESVSVGHFFADSVDQTLPRQNTDETFQQLLNKNVSILDNLIQATSTSHGGSFVDGDTRFGDPQFNVDDPLQQQQLQHQQQ